MSVRIGKKLGIDESYFMILLTDYGILEEKEKRQKVDRPDLSKTRPVVSWDTDIGKIDRIEYKPQYHQSDFEWAMNRRNMK